MGVVLAGLHSFMLLKTVLCITTKRRLCVDYEIPSYRASGHLDITTGQSRGKCISSCVRHDVCLAVNYNPSGGMCELLPEAPICMPTNISPEFSYIHLTNCGGHNPWRTEGASSGSWQWISTNNPVSISASLVPMLSDTTRFVARVLHDGVYTPGWWKDDASMTRIARPTGNGQNCPTSKTTFLSFSRPYRWEPFTVGDSLPRGAVVGGIWSQAIPLFVMKVQVDFHVVSGYYRADIKRAFVVGNSFINPTTMDILVIQWHNIPTDEYIKSIKLTDWCIWF